VGEVALAQSALLVGRLVVQVATELIGKALAQLTAVVAAVPQVAQVTRPQGALVVEVKATTTFHLPTLMATQTLVVVAVA
jgi:hypothetical protein